MSEKKSVEVGKLKKIFAETFADYRRGFEKPLLGETTIMHIIDSLAVELETALLRLEEDAKALPANRDAAHMIEHILASLRADYEDEGNAFGLRMVQDAEVEYAKLKAKREPLPIETLAEDQRALPPEVNEAVNQHFRELIGEPVETGAIKREPKELVKAREVYHRYRYELYHSDIKQSLMLALANYIIALEKQLEALKARVK